jgi:hypothetical protein
MDVLRQQQQAMIQKLTLAQQQAAKPVAMKTPPSPGMTTEALQARLNEQLTTMTTTLQRHQQALTEGLAQGNISAGLAGVMAGRAEATAEQLRAEMELLKGQIDMLSQLHQQETLKLKQLADRYNEAFSVMSNILKTQQDTTKSIIQNMR